MRIQTTPSKGCWHDERPRCLPLRQGLRTEVWRGFLRAIVEWWNLAALCQKCHLKVQGRVRMAQFWMFEHSPWMLPHVQGFYQAKGEKMVIESEESTPTDEPESTPHEPDIPAEHLVPEPGPIGDTGMAIIRVGMDAAVLRLNEEAMRVLNYARQQKIASEDDAKRVADDLITCAALRKQVKEKQAEYLKPIKAHVDDIMARFKLILGPLDEAEDIFRQLVKGWQDACAEKLKAQRELEWLQNQVKAKEAEIQGKPAPVIPPSDLALQPDHHRIRATAGDIGTMEVKKWRVTDFAKIPDRFKLLDTVAINRLVKGGGTCEGIEVYVEYVPRVIGRKC